MKTILLSGLLSAAIISGAALADNADTSSADEIKASLVGNTFTGDMGSAEYTSYFSAGGEYFDASGSGIYEVSDEGVCYPGTDFGCYAAKIEGDQLTWFKDGENVGSGTIVQGDALHLETPQP